MNNEGSNDGNKSAGDNLNRDIGNIVDFIEDIFERRGADSYLGEAVTMSQHMLQTARLAEQFSGKMPSHSDIQTSLGQVNLGHAKGQLTANDALVVAALLHDIGHYTSEFPADAADHGINNLHDQAGAKVIARWFPPLVIDCIRYHVDAKRYLCAVEKSYGDGLSDASRLSLSLQGGPMNKNEVAEFSTMPNIDAILQVRRWDDLAKDPAIDTPPFAHYRPSLERVSAWHLQTRKIHENDILENKR